jgi:hypothetical protein
MIKLCFKLLKHLNHIFLENYWSPFIDYFKFCKKIFFKSNLCSPDIKDSIKETTKKDYKKSEKVHLNSSKSISY